jgi:BirA family biotin operon repressor/biotin-[acetyl-CoA-carboxylase] ligase
LQEKLYKIPANTQIIGKKIICLPTCHSTNDIASEIASQIEEGAVVITHHQTKGRGQRGNAWEAEAGANLTFSVVLKPSFLPVHQQFYLNIAVTLAIIDALYTFLPDDKLKIKWSNDIYYADAKLGGILIENTLEVINIKSAIVGIGLNINQTQFSHPKAISLKNILQIDFFLPEVLEKILECLEMRYLALKDKKFSSLRQDYLSRLYWYKEEHLFRDDAGSEFVGQIIGVQENGRLIIQVEGGVYFFNFKEVIFVK